MSNDTQLFAEYYHEYDMHGEKNPAPEVGNLVYHSIRRTYCNDLIRYLKSPRETTGLIKLLHKNWKKDCAQGAIFCCQFQGSRNGCVYKYVCLS